MHIAVDEDPAGAVVIGHGVIAIVDRVGDQRRRIGAGVGDDGLIDHAFSVTAAERIVEIGRRYRRPGGPDQPVFGIVAIDPAAVAGQIAGGVVGEKNMLCVQFSVSVVE